MKIAVQLTEDHRRTLTAAGLDADAVLALVRSAVDEDLAGGPDATTTATVPAAQRCRGALVSRADGVVAGLVLVPVVLSTVSDAVGSPGTATMSTRVGDGDHVAAGDTLATIEGPTRLVLTAERTVLNLLCHLSGIATLTDRWVTEVAGTAARIRDTRKTTPGLRSVEKYAVRCGGGVNHRMSLSDAALVKDNHVLAAGGVVPAFRAVRAAAPQLPIEVEVDTLAEAEEAAQAGAELILLDNFTIADTVAAVRIAGAHGARTEASGGLTLDVAAEVAATGVDFLAVGALTHSAPSLDLGLDISTDADSAPEKENG